MSYFDNKKLISMPEPVENFIFDLFQAVRYSCRMDEVQRLYEIRLKELTEQYYPTSHWPHVDQISAIIGQDELFLALYKYGY